jgi:hypothetical protein
MSAPKVIVDATDSAGYQAVHLVGPDGAKLPDGHLGYFSVHGFTRVELSASCPLPADEAGKLVVT